MLAYKLWVLLVVVFLFCRFLVRGAVNEQKMRYGRFDLSKMTFLHKTMAVVGFSSAIALFGLSIFIVVTF
jgi:hypothetical protein